MLAPAFDVVTNRSIEDTLLVRVDEQAEITLPTLASSPALTSHIGATHRQLADPVVSVMKATANDGLLRVNTDLGILVAGHAKRAEGLDIEHARRFDGIQAGHAGNAGKLLQQYLQFAAAQPAIDRYETTLTICTLHSLLTQCAELLKYKPLSILPDLQEPLTDTPNCLGLTASLVVRDTFPEPLTGAGLLGHLRDALSHPAPDEEFHFRPTGFTTTGEDGGLILGYVFTNSPWIKDDKRYAIGEQLPCPTERAAKGVISGFCRRDRKDFALDVLPLENGRFDVGRDGQPYVPQLVAELPLDVLINMTLSLAERLNRHVEPASR